MKSIKENKVHGISHNLTFVPKSRCRSQITKYIDEMIRVFSNLIRSFNLEF